MGAAGADSPFARMLAGEVVWLLDRLEVSARVGA